jgi:hypothetical protein
MPRTTSVGGSSPLRSLRTTLAVAGVAELRKVDVS